MSHTTQKHNTEDFLFRLYTLQEQVLTASEVRPQDLGDSVDPFDVVAELLLAAVDEPDMAQVRRLTAALEFAQVLRRTCQAYDANDLTALPGLVAEAESLVPEALGEPLAGDVAANKVKLTGPLKLVR